MRPSQHRFPTPARAECRPPAASPLDEAQPPLATLDTDLVEPVRHEPPADQPMAIRSGRFGNRCPDRSRERRRG